MTIEILKGLTLLWESHALADHHYSKFFIAGGLVLSRAGAVMGLLVGHLPIGSCFGCEPPPSDVYLVPMNNFFVWFAYPAIWIGLGMAVVSVNVWCRSLKLIQEH